MSEGMNKVILLGNLGADPELRYTGSGMAVLNLRLATCESYMDRNMDLQERTEWHTVVFWGARGEGLAKVLAKGDCVYVDGTLRTSSYEKDGQKRFKTEVIGRELRFTGRREPPSAEDAAAQTAAPATARLGMNGAKPRLDAPVSTVVEEMPY